ncbi:hypothetical protein HJC23_005256 [Cyclotella cryptica]|uniref:Uncharacterized protein n=1 Tax=Cyclotella cryptica TaxID=29204 RepID=A0ABD3PLI6_9STRA|eukprot:CCRYP_013592-RA/>CCRYP_013592-RA protein AED:0.23 eAED:0.23 QI:0/-1/0/1/-1/1/1/0/175
MSNSDLNNAQGLPGLLLLLHAAEVEDHDETSFLTPPRLIKTVANKSTHAPKRPTKRYQPENPKSALPLKKRWKEGSGVISTRSPTVQGSPTKVERVTCSQPNTHIIWESAAWCQHAMTAASPFRSRQRSSGTSTSFNYLNAQGTLRGTDTTTGQDAKSSAFRYKILEDVRRKMDF